jgi:O-antigen/teichoic acid export membrane protein
MGEADARAGTALSRNPLFARVSALVSRYGALAAQFLIVILVARHLPKADAGTYLLVFGAITTTSVFAGFGAPDGLVKALPELMHGSHPGAVRTELKRSASFTAGTSVLLVAVLAAIGLSRGYGGMLLLLSVTWWLAYATVFFCGQALVALGSATLGAFVFYALNNLLLLVTTAPYLLIDREASVQGALQASNVAGWSAAVLGIVILAVAARRLPAGTDRTTPRGSTFKLGLIIAAARMFQAALYWVPAWAVAAASGPADAAVMSTAGRLLIAATAVIAVFRFTIRGRIVAAGARGDSSAIERMARAAATISTLIALVALLTVLAAGRPVISLIFGAGFREAGPVLAVLLVGAIGESVGGPVDEVLKYRGYAMPVLAGLIVTVAVEVALAWVLAPHGALAAAAAQAIAFCGMYAYQIILCRTRLGLLILPYVSVKRFRAALAD